MRKLTMLSVFCATAFCASVVCAAENQFQFFLTQPYLTPTPAAQLLNVEHPFRCDVNDVGPRNVSMTIPVTKKDFTLTRFDTIGKLPRFEVNGFTFENLPVDEAIQALVDEAGISVFTSDGVYPEMSGNNVFGELTDVVNELTKTGDVFYTYNADRKELNLSKSARFELSLPKNKTVMFAVLDAVRGADITTAVPNWDKHTVMLTLNRAEQTTVEDLLAAIVKDSKLLLLDVQVYQLDVLNRAGVPWQQIVDQFGAGRIHAENKGLIGKVLTMGSNKTSDSLLGALNKNYASEKISQGIAVVPHTWKMRFDVGRCSFTRDNINSLSLLLNANIKSASVIETNITLDTLGGEVSAFNAVSGLDDEVVIIGVPATVVHPARKGELFITLKIRLIRLIPEGK